MMWTCLRQSVAQQQIYHQFSPFSLLAEMKKLVPMSERFSRLWRHLQTACWMHGDSCWPISCFASGECPQSIKPSWTGWRLLKIQERSHGTILWNISRTGLFPGHISAINPLRLRCSSQPDFYKIYFVRIL